MLYNNSAIVKSYLTIRYFWITQTSDYHLCNLNEDLIKELTFIFIRPEEMNTGNIGSQTVHYVVLGGAAEQRREDRGASPEHRVPLPAGHAVRFPYLRVGRWGPNPAMQTCFFMILV